MLQSAAKPLNSAFRLYAKMNTPHSSTTSSTLFQTPTLLSWGSAWVLQRVSLLSLPTQFILSKERESSFKIDYEIDYVIILLKLLISVRIKSKALPVAERTLCSSS